MRVNTKHIFRHAPALITHITHYNLIFNTIKEMWSHNRPLKQEVAIMSPEYAICYREEVYAFSIVSFMNESSLHQQHHNNINMIPIFTNDFYLASCLRIRVISGPCLILARKLCPWDFTVNRIVESSFPWNSLSIKWRRLIGSLWKLYLSSLNI